MTGVQIGNCVVWPKTSDRGSVINIKRHGAPADTASTLTVDEAVELRAALAEFLPDWARGDDRA